MPDPQEPELNERISLLIEPKPEIIKDFAHAGCAVRLHAGWRLWHSPKEAWVFCNAGWRERDWTGDEAASAMLLDLIGGGYLNRDSKTQLWVCRIGEECFTNPDRKTAIALAFLQWKDSTSELNAK